MSDHSLSGAQALAEILSRNGTRKAFAYPGTSELALCAALHRAGIDVINSRGDKDAVFMAAGHNSIRPSTAIAVLHGQSCGTPSTPPGQPPSSMNIARPVAMSPTPSTFDRHCPRSLSRRLHTTAPATMGPREMPCYQPVR
jgi:hypothetical protein